jgi:acetyltransferase-like isoleucine patch superfamily enzyme
VTPPGSAIIAAEKIARVLVSPAVMAYRMGLLSFHSAGQALSLAPGAAGLLLRRAWYRATLDACGERLGVEFGTVIHKAGSRIGDDCYFGELNRIGLVDIGDNFMSANHVSIMSGRRQHAFDRRDTPMRSQPVAYERIVVGEDVWIGAQATVTSDVSAHSIVAAGAVVTESFDAWRILGGVPARVLGERP